MNQDINLKLIVSFHQASGVNQQKIPYLLVNQSVINALYYAKTSNSSTTIFGEKRS